MRLTFSVAISVVAWLAVFSVSVADETPPKSSQNAKPFKRPELVAITWQQVPENNNKRIVQPVWRPDGTLMPEAEVEQLLDAIKSFQTHWWNEAEQLRPLVMIFAVDDRHEKTTVMCSLVIDGKRRLGGGSGHFVGEHRLAKSALAPEREFFKSWPETLTVDAKVPSENPQPLKVTQDAPDAEVELGSGVRWFVSPSLGEKEVDGKRKAGFPATVLAIRRDTEDDMVSYGVRVTWKDGRERQSGGYTTTRDLGGGEEVIRVSGAIGDNDRIDRVEFTRQQFRWERYEIPLRLDLLPK